MTIGYPARHSTGRTYERNLRLDLNSYPARHAAPVTLPGDRDDVTVTHYSGHGLGHHYRADMPSRVPTPGPQTPVPPETSHRVPRKGREL